MKTALKVLGVVVLVLVLLGFGGFTWARGKNAELLGRTIPVHSVDFPVPFPLDSAEAADLGVSGPEADAVALERAVARGRHLVESRYVCVECHGDDFGGGVMIDAPIMGRLLGPNLTTGQGSVTLAYTPADWDRMVRHGVKPSGNPSAMPSEDFRLMSDRELSDIVAYIRSMPPVDEEVPPVTFGPVGTMLMATGKIPLSADIIGEHQAPHSAFPPEAAATVAYGAHIGAVCTGCHGQDLAGGPIPGGDPAWLPAANLTPHADGLAGWSLDDFATLMREGRRPDGSAVGAPMTIAVQYTQNMSDLELEALWMYLQSTEARPGN